MQPDHHRSKHRGARGLLSTVALGAGLALVLAACGDDRMGPKLQEGGQAVDAGPAAVVGTPNKQDWKQCQNNQSYTDDCDWVTGNLNQTHNTYAEGDFVPKVLRVPGIEASDVGAKGVGPGVEVVMTYGFLKGGLTTHDFLGRWDLTMMNANPCVDGSFSMFCDQAGPTGSLQGLFVESNLLDQLSQDAVEDPAACGTAGSYDEYMAAAISAVGASNLVIEGLNVHEIEVTDIEFDGCPVSGDAEALLTMTIYPTAAAESTGNGVLLLFGAHVARETDWQNGGAGGVSGSPYHLGLVSVNGASAGSMDLQMAAAAIIPTSTITIVKDAIPDSDQDFAFTRTGFEDNTGFSLEDDGDEADELASSITFGPLTEGTYTIDETAVPGWSLTDITCTPGDATSVITTDATGVDIELVAGEDIVCTFTNELQDAAIRVVKVADAPGDFDFTRDFGDGFTLSPAEPGLSDETLFMGVDPTQVYSITETLNADFDFVSVACELEDATSTGTPGGTGVTNVGVNPGETTTCTFTNALKDGSLTVIKNSGDDEGDFEFTRSFGDNFTLSTTGGPPATDQTTFEDLDPTQTYDVAEILNPGFDFTGASCLLEDGTTSTGTTDGGSGLTGIVVEPGKNTTCTFTNALKSASLKIIKVADAPGTFEFTRTFGDNFTLSPADPELMDMQTFTNLDATQTYGVDEVSHPAFSFLGASCELEDATPTGNSSETGVSGIELRPGEQTTCTFTNQLRPGSLKVIKLSGDTEAAFEFTRSFGDNFTLTTTGGPPATDMAEFDLLSSTETYTVTEIVPDFWQLTSASCELEDATSTGSASGDGITGIEVEPGRLTTCTFVNAPLMAQALLIEKTANTSYVRTHTWDVEKDLTNPPDGPLDQGQVYVLMYEVQPVLTGTTDTEHTVSGQITVTNQNAMGSPFVATVSSVSDVLSAGGTDINATITSCSPMLPTDLGPGDVLTCDYTVTDPGLAANAMWTNTASVTAVWNDAMDASGTGMADATFGDPSNEIDECVDVVDSLEGPLGTVCVTDLPVGPFTYDWQLNGDGGDQFLVCGPNQINNIATSTTNDTNTEATASETVDITVMCDPGCTLTQGYWKTHSDEGPAPYDEEGWGNLGDYDGDGVEEEEDESLVGTDGNTFYEIFWTPVRGRPWYQVAHQYMAAYLNIQNGADPTDLNGEMPDIRAWLESADPERRNRDLPPPERQDARDWNSLLSDYNEGLIGPGHCAEDEMSEN